MLAKIGMLTSLTAAAAAQALGPGALPVESAAVLQFEGIVRQQSDHTCGYAAAATVLQILGLSVDEASLVRAVEAGDGTGASVAAIGRAVAPWGVRSFAVNSTWEKLSRYFDRYVEPVVALVDAGRPHFTVVLGMDAEAAYLADPSQGYRVLTRLRFQQHWTGVVLFLRRAEEQETAGSTGQAGPFEALGRLRLRHHRLLRTQADLGIVAGAGRIGL